MKLKQKKYNLKIIKTKKIIKFQKKKLFKKMLVKKKEGKRRNKY